MRILLLTQYFPPEIGAPQNRLYELAVRLAARGATVDVLTAFPNYPHNRIYEGYRRSVYRHEVVNGLSVYRTYIWVSRRGSIAGRLVGYFSFVLSSLLAGLSVVPRPDYVVCESPPLFLGITGYVLSRVNRASFLFNVSDLWPQSAEALGLVTNRRLLRIARWLEEGLYRSAHTITGQTQGIVQDIRTRMPTKPVRWLPNGADLSFYDPDSVDGAPWRREHGFADDDMVFLYAGLMGYAQGLEVIIRAATQLMEYKQVKFVLVGNGPLKDELIRLRQELRVDNVFVLDAVSKAEMPRMVKAADVGIVPLRKGELFKGAIPSKIFELLAMRKPILLGVDGEAKRLFIDQARCGAFFKPEDPNDLACQVKRLITERDRLHEMGLNGAHYVRSKFNRDTIAEELWQYLCRAPRSPESDGHLAESITFPEEPPATVRVPQQGGEFATAHRCPPSDVAHRGRP